MSSAVYSLLDSLNQLSAAERVEFLSLVAIPSETTTEDWTENDFSTVAAQTFARLDSEEERNAGSNS